MVFRAFRSPVAAFNRLVPKDLGSKLTARDQAFGEHPRHRLDLYRPRAAGAEPLPVIIFFYGGSWASGLRQDYAFAGRAFAAKGFLTAVPDYRLVPEARYPTFVEDGAAAVRWLRRHAAEHGGNPERIVLIGHSAGAYIAAMLALDPARLGKHRQAVRGFIGLSGPYDFLPLTSAATRAAFGHEEDLAATQPVNFTLPGSPRALLLHGGRDRTVFPRNSHALAKRLQAAGCDARVRIYPALTHVDLATSLALPFRRRAPVLADAVAFARDVAAG